MTLRMCFVPDYSHRSTNRYFLILFNATRFIDLMPLLLLFWNSELLSNHVYAIREKITVVHLSFLIPAMCSTFFNYMVPPRCFPIFVATNNGPRVALNESGTVQESYHRISKCSNANSIGCPHPSIALTISTTLEGIWIRWLFQRLDVSLLFSLSTL